MSSALLGGCRGGLCSGYLSLAANHKNVRLEGLSGYLTGLWPAGAKAHNLGEVMQLSKATLPTRGGGSVIKEQLEAAGAVKELVAPKRRSVSQR